MFDDSASRNFGIRSTLNSLLKEVNHKVSQSKNNTNLYIYPRKIEAQPKLFKYLEHLTFNL